VNHERRYIHLQVVGMSFWLSILPSIILAEMFGLEALIGRIIVGLYVIGAILFCWGLVGRRELREKQQPPPNCPK